MKYLFSFLTVALLLTLGGVDVLAQDGSGLPGGVPETLGEATEMGKKALFVLPEVIKKPWQEVLEIWKRMLGWFKDIWSSYIGPWFKTIWQNILFLLGKEVEKRKPEIQEEFEKEKQELKEEIPRATHSLWQRFKELIK